MSRTARVLVIEPGADTDSCLSAGLRRFGFDCIGSQASGANRLLTQQAGRPDFVIIDAKALVADTTLDEVTALAASARIPAMLVGADMEALRSRLDIGWHDVVLGSPSPVYLANRIHAAMRLSGMQAELDRRIATCARYGVDAPLPVLRPNTIDQAAVLVLGPGIAFSTIDEALSSSADIVGAFSPAMAIDYLASRPFDLVVADMGAGFETICDLAGDLRRDPRFFAMPLLLLGAPAESGWTEAALNAGITEIVPAPVSARALRSRAMSLAREHRFARALKGVYEDARHIVSGDALTGLYTRGFLMEHLRSLLDAAPRPRFSLAALAIRNIAAINDLHGYAAGDRIIRQVGMILGNLLRGEDLPARLGGARFAAIVIETDHDAAYSIMRRVTSFVSATQFSVSGADAPLRVELAVNIVEPADGITPDRLVAEAVAGLR